MVAAQAMWAPGRISGTPTIGSTSPRDPYAGNSTSTSRPPFPQILVSASDYAA
jgi:hypothetical protein